MRIAAVIALLCMFIASACSRKEAPALPDEQVVDIASRAYVFGYPLVLMDYTRRVGCNVERPTDAGRAPVNQIGHLRTFPDHTFTDVVKPNVDTYYSIAWFDLSSEPVVMTVPASERYYLLPLLDAYTNVFSVPGTRTTGTTAHTFLLTGPGWNSALPEGMERISAPTNLAWLIGRTMVRNAEDGARIVHPFQNGITLTPLSAYGSEYTPPQGIVHEEYKSIVPVSDVQALPVEEYFNLLMQLMTENPPAEADSLLVREMASIGIVPGGSFNMEAFTPQLQEQLRAIPAAVHAAWKQKEKETNPALVKNGWIMLSTGMGNYGTDYDFRAFIAYFGLGANLPEDAIYPSTVADSDGDALDGTKSYRLHFEAEELPPVNAFWSLTAYDSRDLLVPNDKRRYALGDRDPLSYNPDGSLDIYIQHANPGPAHEANWLPSPSEGRLNLTLRLYWPKEEALNGLWVPPPVLKEM